MALPLYLAQTPAEMVSGGPLPDHFAYMACHFSPYGKGLSNLPAALPEGAMLILDDSTPICGHDHRLITNQLVKQIQLHRCGSVLLDFERTGYEELHTLVKSLCGALPCPVGVSALYARDADCPVFLSPVPADRPVKEYLAPWTGREIWLEAALDGLELTLTAQGCTVAPLFDFPLDGIPDDKLHCRYTIETGTAAKFRLWRTREDLDALLAEVPTFGVTRTVGLWQELGR